MRHVGGAVEHHAVDMAVRRKRPSVFTSVRKTEADTLEGAL